MKAFKATQTSNPPVFMKPKIQEKRNIKNIYLVIMKQTNKQTINHRSVEVRAETS